MPTTLLAAPRTASGTALPTSGTGQNAVPPAAHRPAARAAATAPRSLSGAELVRSLFGPALATVEELVARDIEAFTARRLARGARTPGPVRNP